MRPASRRDCLGAALALLALGVARAAAPEPPPELTGGLPGARLQAQAPFTFFGVSIYDIRLWVGAGFEPAAWERFPLALELIYGHKLRGDRIAERSLLEMRRAGPLDEARAAEWLAAMKAAFPDVAVGDRLTGLFEPASGTSRFAFNGQALREWRDAEFTRRFPGIWLGAQTSEPRLRQALLGPAAAR